MFDKYVIGEGTVRNLDVDGETIGFRFDSRIAYYRGLGVSMVEPFEVSVDGESIPTQDLRFTLGERTWTFDELATDYEARWELLDTAQVTVLMPGGLAPGEHEIDVIEVLRVSYLPMPSRTQFRRTVEVA